MAGAILASLTSACRQTNPGGNYSTNGYVSRIPTTTRPDQQTPTGGVVGDGVIPWGISSGTLGNYSPYGIRLIPYGVGADDTTFKMLILGWDVTNIGVVSGQPLWIPMEILEVTCTLSATTGVANSDIPATQSFADAIAITSGGPTLQPAAAPNTIPPIVPDFALFSNPADTIGWVLLRGLGFPFLEVIFSTGGSATSCNALWRPI